RDGGQFFPGGGLQLAAGRNEVDVRFGEAQAVEIDAVDQIDLGRQRLRGSRVEAASEDGRATDGRQVRAAVVGADEGLDVGRPGAGRAEVGGDAEVEGGPVEGEGGGVQAVGQDRERPANVAGDVAADAASGGPAGHQDRDRVGGSQGVAEGGL